MVGEFVGPRSRWFMYATCAAVVTSAAAIPSRAQVVPAPSRHVATNVVESPTVPIITIDLDHALLRTALDTIAHEAGLSPVYGDAVSSATSRVSVHVRHAPVTAAFEQALKGTGLAVVILPNGYVKFVERSASTQDASSIHGTVTDARTKQPIAGATVLLDSARKGVLTRNDGTFLIPSVPLGTHTVSVRMLRYARQSRRVVVSADQSRRVDFALSESVNALDQVVVTGSIAAVQQREISNAVTVITAKQIEDRNILHIDQLFRGDVPGVFAPNFGTAPRSNLGGLGPSKYGSVVMYSRGSTVLPTSGVGGTDAPVDAKTIKTYVDGVLIADPDYLNQIDTKSIDHIEIITGPQASTLYGSDALGGVMQIFTKRGHAGQQRPELTASVEYGMIQNNFSSSLAPRHNDNIQVTDVVGPISYNLGGSYGYEGQWTPGHWTRSTSVFGGGRRTGSKISVDLTARATQQTSGDGGGSLQQGLAQAIADGIVPYSAYSVIPVPATAFDVTGETYGTTVSYTPFAWLHNQVTVGLDQSAYASTARGATYLTPADSLNISRSIANTEAVSASFNTTLDNTISVFRSTLTFGADLRHTHNQTIVESGNDISTFDGAYDTRTRDKTAGGFGQWLLGYQNAVFLTLALRGEKNPNYGSGHKIDYAPRYGLSIVHDIGTVTAKLRYTEGRSTRAPVKGQTEGIQWCTQNPGFYCDYYTGLYGPGLTTQLSAPRLLPESQRGPEYGIDLFFGNRGSFSLTSYNQKVYNLISSVQADTVFALDSASYPYPFFSTQFQNVGDVKNSGLTAEGSINQGPFSLQATYSWTKSRIVRLAPGFIGVDKVGDSFQNLPEHTGAATLSYTNAAVLLSATVNFTGQILDPKSVNGQAAQFGLRTGEAYVPRIFDSQPLTALSPSAQVALNASRVINRYMTLYASVANATNYYQNEGNQGNLGTFPVMGRQTTVGARFRF